MEAIKYMTGLLTFYIKGEIATEQNFLKIRFPNTLLALIPFLNLFMIPAAVCGGTALWVDILRPDFENDIRKYEAELEERT